jgi:hypothetical protein
VHRPQPPKSKKNDILNIKYIYYGGGIGLSVEAYSKLLSGEPKEYEFEEKHNARYCNQRAAWIRHVGRVKWQP